MDLTEYLYIHEGREEGADIGFYKIIGGRVTGHSELTCWTDISSNNINTSNIFKEVGRVWFDLFKCPDYIRS